jgi:hypothetical protein
VALIAGRAAIAVLGAIEVTQQQGYSLAEKPRRNRDADVPDVRADEPDRASDRFAEECAA